MEVYLAASGASEKDGKVQTAITLSCAGPHVLEVYDTFIWTDDKGDKDRPDKVLEALERYCNARDNEAIESRGFWNIPYQEPFDKILRALKTRAAACNFLEKDRRVERQNSFSCDWKTSRITSQGRQFDTRQSSKNL